MKELIISLVRPIRLAAKAIVSVFKAVVIAVRNLIVHVTKRVAKFIKTIALLIWDYFLNYIVRFLLKCTILLYLVIKYIIIKIYIGFKILSLLIWKYILKYIFLLFKYIMLGLFIITHYCYKGFVVIAKFFWKKVIFPLKAIFKKIFLKIKYILDILGKIVKHIGIWFWDYFLKHIVWILYKVFLGIKFIYLKIYCFIYILLESILKYIVIICRFIRTVSTVIWNGIKFVLFKLYILFKYIFMKLYIFTLCFIKAIKYLIKSLPDWLYRFINVIFIYFVLFIKFIFYDLFKLLLYGIPKYLINLIYKGLVKIFILLFDCIKLLINKIGQLLSYIGKALKVVFMYLRDYLEYYYIVLLSPIIIIIFVVMTILAIIKLFINFVVIAFKSLMGKRVLEYNEIIYIKNTYFPSTNIFINAMSFNSNLKYNYVFGQKLQSSWILVNIFVWQLLYMTIFISITAIILLPVSLFSLLFKRNKDIRSRIIVLSRNFNGLIKFKKVKIFGHIIEGVINSETYLEESTNQLIIKDCILEKNSLSIKKDNKLIAEFELSIKQDLNYEALKELFIIKEQLISMKYFQFNLPACQNSNLIVRYEKNWNRDKLTNSHMTLRSAATKTSIKVILCNLDGSVLVEQDVSLKKLTNPTAICRIANSNRVLYIKSGQFITRAFENKYRYIFEETDKVTRDGKVITVDDEQFITNVYIDGFKDIIYHIQVNVITDKTILNKYKDQLYEDLIVWDKKQINLRDIKRTDGSFKKVEWYINHKKTTSLSDQNNLFELFSNCPKIKVTSVFIFNNRIVSETIKIKNQVINKQDSLLKSLVSTFENEYIINDKSRLIIKPNDLRQIGRNSFYIHLPTIANSKNLLIRWKSLNKNIMKSSGKIIDSDFKEVRYKVVVYRNLFIKRKYQVTILLPNC